MGSDPQSYLQLMHEIEHEACRKTEQDLQAVITKQRKDLAKLKSALEVEKLQAVYRADKAVTDAERIRQVLHD